MRSIAVRGARTNNLRGIDLGIEPGTLLVVCGPSGAGKSSLAFGTLYAEGQRRYVESFSAYARQFLERLERPPVDSLEWVPPAIAVDRAAPVKSSRSTVATMTELSEYAKHLWSAAATLDCVACGAAVRAHSATSAADALLLAASGEKVVVTYPAPVMDAERYLELRDALVASGYRRVWLDGSARDLDHVPPSAVVGSLDVITDRAVVREPDRARLVEALEAAFERGEGEARVFSPDGRRWAYSRALRCDACGASYRRPHAGTFSYESPIGACETCRGFGRTLGVDWEKVMPDRSKSLGEGAIRPWAGKAASWERRLLRRFCEREGIPMDVPLRDLPDDLPTRLVEGDGGNWRTGYPGLRRWFEWLESRAYKMHVRVLLSRYRSYDICASCRGGRFKPEVSGWKLGGNTLPGLYALPIVDARAVLDRARAAHGRDPAIARLFDECGSRLGALCDVGLGYLTLDRSTRTLSGGELQRVSLTSALGSALTGTLFVLDEPTVGLHPRDAARLLGVVRRIAQGDNVAVVVEAEQAFVTGADRVVELGPAGGEAGGRIVFDGTPAELARAATATGRALRASAVRRARRKGKGAIVVSRCTGNNLRDVELRLPLGVFSCVTGVSGSGKSTLVLDTLVPALARARGETSAVPLPHAELRIEGTKETIGGLVVVDQAPLGRTGRGNPATYSGAWDGLRKLLSRTPLARARGYGPGTFSFNVPGGRCEACKGEGAETVEMQFLADVHLSCPECSGRRFSGPVLDVAIEGCNAADLLELTVAEVARRFAASREVARALAPLVDVGIGYLRLGQPLNTLSGGEAQRLRLAAALSEAVPSSLVVLDEPTAGLHPVDVEPLLVCLDRLVDAGHTVVVVEHDMRVAAHADHVIDLGPGAGAEGGRIVTQGTPEVVAASAESLTAAYLRAVLTPEQAPTPRVPKRGSDAEDGRVVSVRGAREHNLRDVDVDVPREQLVVVTGPSGSGKSTLAFDVIFSESQRRYFETLPPYVRQYLKELPRAAVDQVSGMPPGVALDQRQGAGGANSTVATVTEVAHYLRLLWARAGTLRCPTCALPITPRTLDAIARDVRGRFRSREVQVLAPVVRGRKGHHRELLDRLQDQGLRRARIDGKWRELAPGLGLARYREHDVEVLVGGARASSAELRGLLERALALGEGSVGVFAGEDELLLSARRACPKCGRGFPDLDPRFFSFNTRQGGCPRCEGKGVVERVQRGEIRHDVCPECQGKRLAGLALHTTVDGMLLTELLALSVERAHARLRRVKLTGRERTVGERALREALARLGFLVRIGLSYLALDRAARGLSGGELQRVRLAAQLGSGLTGVLYVLDEPTIGLHARDTAKLVAALRALVDQGCSVLVVEHDADTIRASDRVIDMGPGGGRLGGRIVAQGSPRALAADPRSVTGAALARPLALRAERRRVVRDTPRLVLSGARAHNLRDVELRIPLGRFVAVTGVSGSGKSTLVRATLLPALRLALGLSSEPAGTHAALDGLGPIRRALEIDQTPIGRTPRSVPATYVGVWDEIRRLFAQAPEARMRGWNASRFSFNVAAGRCPTCEGQGEIRLEMAFLPQAHVRCETCDGQRFGPETLDVRLRGMSAGQLLDMHVGDALELLGNVPKIRRPLELLCDLGLAYLTLGQPSNSLSGGEAQRMKLVSELSGGANGTALYVMDEPTTGLHRDDVARLLGVLQTLVDRGHTLVVIEHHPDVIAAADWVVDLGPEGGEHGGRIVAQGTPQDLLASRKSHTGAMLRDALGASP